MGTDRKEQGGSPRYSRGEKETPTVEVWHVSGCHVKRPAMLGGYSRHVLATWAAAALWEVPCWRLSRSIQSTVRS